MYMRGTARNRIRVLAGALAFSMVVLTIGLTAPCQADDASVLDWPGDYECVACHVNEAESMVVPEEGSVTDDQLDDETDDVAQAKPAALHAMLECVACHDDADKLAKAHGKIKATTRIPMRLKKTQVENDICLTCHDQESLVEATEGCEVLTDGNGIVVNPHALPQVEAHEGLLCSNCHELHSDASELHGEAQKLCITCHHAGVYECFTCHDHS